MNYFKAAWLILVGCSLFLTSQAQQAISGRVVDAANETPLIGASIRALPSEEVTITDRNGEFSIQNGSIDSLQVSFVGYERRNIAASSSYIIIRLEPDEHMLANVVVKAFESGRSLISTPGSIEVLTPKALKRDNNVLIVPSLNRVPGVLMQSGALNTNRLTIRGIGARTPFGTDKIRAYLNQIPLTNGSGETTIEDIDLDLIQRVEVIKGPSASVYGSGLGGTVILDIPGGLAQPSSVSSEIIGGSFGTVKSNTRLRINEDNLSLGIAYNYLKSDGYRENNAYDRKALTATGQVIANKSRISFFGTFIDLLAFIPSSIDSATFATNPRAAAGSWGSVQGYEDNRKALLGLSLNQQLGEQFSLDLSLFQSFRENYEVRPFNILKENTSAAGTRNLLKFKPESGILKEVAAGFEYFRDNYRWNTYVVDNREPGPALSDNDEDRDYLNIFTQVKMQFGPKLSSELGVNFNTTGYRLTDYFNPDSTNLSGTYTFDDIVSPRITLRYAINERQNLYALASHGFSPPTLAETLTPEGQINPEIQPEQGFNYEFGYKGSPLRNLYLSAALYSMQIRDLIVADRVTADIFVGRNAGRTTHNGLELHADWVFTAGRFEATPFMNYTFANYRFQEFVDEDNDYSGNELTGVPRNQLSAGVDFRIGPCLYGNVNYLFVDEMPMRDDNTAYSEAYGITNLQLGWRKTLGSFYVDAYGGIRNIFDVKYASMIQVNAPSFGGRQPRYYYPGLPVNYYGGLSLSWNFGSY